MRNGSQSRSIYRRDSLPTAAMGEPATERRTLPRSRAPHLEKRNARSHARDGCYKLGPVSRSPAGRFARRPDPALAPRGHVPYLVRDVAPTATSHTWYRTGLRRTRHTPGTGRVRSELISVTASFVGTMQTDGASGAHRHVDLAHAGGGGEDPHADGRGRRRLGAPGRGRGRRLLRLPVRPRLRPRRPGGRPRVRVRGRQG